MISVPTASPSRATLWAIDAISELLEDLQFTFDEGPAWRLQPLAARRPLVASVHHGSDTARWPIFAAAVADQTLVGALFALPLQWGAINLGVLDMYRAAPVISHPSPAEAAQR